MWRWDALQNFSPIEDGVLRMQSPSPTSVGPGEDANRWRIDSPRRRFHRPLALSREHQRPKAGDSRHLECGASADYNGIYLIEPFDPRRIPVLLHPWTHILAARLAKRRHRRNGESVDPGKLSILVCLFI
jgi:hypothetical protein